MSSADNKEAICGLRCCLKPGIPKKIETNFPRLEDREELLLEVFTSPSEYFGIEQKPVATTQVRNVFLGTLFGGSTPFSQNEI